MLNQEDQGSSSRDSTAFGNSDSVGVENVIVEFWWGVKVNLDGVFGKSVY